MNSTLTGIACPTRAGKLPVIDYRCDGGKENADLSPAHWRGGTETYRGTTSRPIRPVPCFLSPGVDPR